MDQTLIFSIIILIFSVVIHEVAHGYAALFLGDTTAKFSGRLTLNPLPHVSLLGSIIVPLFFVLLQVNLLIGWAKPVPYNPYNLNNRRWGEIMVALAGPLSNFFIAFIFGLLIRFSDSYNASFAFVEIMITIVLINITLAVFNLIPVPPLDGSKILFGFLPESTYKFREFLETNGFIIFLFVAFFAWKFLIPVIAFFFKLFTGL